MMRSKESIITPEIIKEREDRHRRLMRMIKNYRRTNQEIKTLEKIKNNTVMEINLRYLRSEHNRHYIFPRIHIESSDDEEENLQRTNPFSLKQNIMYDLRTQNEIKAPKNAHHSHQSSYRVKSLEREKADVVQHRLGRLKGLKEREISTKNLRKGSMTQQKRVFSTIKLPELKREKIKTEIKTGNESIQIQKIIGKKLMTEANSPTKKEIIANYLKRQDERKSKKKLLSLKKYN